MNLVPARLLAVGGVVSARMLAVGGVLASVELLVRSLRSPSRTVYHRAMPPSARGAQGRR